MYVWRDEFKLPIDCLETIDPGLCEGLCDAQVGSCTLTETLAMGETHNLILLI